jgi:ABC-type sulfate transport system permease component
VESWLGALLLLALLLLKLPLAGSFPRLLLLRSHKQPVMMMIGMMASSSKHFASTQMTAVLAAAAAAVDAPVGHPVPYRSSLYVVLLPQSHVKYTELMFFQKI